MKTFKEYLLEAVPAGNYVSIKASDPGDVWEEMYISAPKTGVAPPNGDYHVTLMYSEYTNENIDRISDVLKHSGMDKCYNGRVIAADCFDADDESKSCIVLKLDPIELCKIHDYLKSFGLVHSYSEFEPHITLRYNMDAAEAHHYKALINTSLETGNWKHTAYLYGIKSETINKNYV